MTLDDEKRGREIGVILTKLEFIERSQVQLSEKMDAGFSALECKQNTKDLREVFGWYQERKEDTKTARRTIITQFISSAVGGLLVLLGYKLT